MKEYTEHPFEVGETRIIPKGTKFWSINNQSNLMSDEDEIIEITHTCYGSDIIFVKPKQLIFNFIGHIPTLIGKGKDEWELSYSKTLPYTVPKPNIPTISYRTDNQ